MYSLAVERSRWLAELAQAVADAQQLLRGLAAMIALDEEALGLDARLERLSEEIERLRRGRARLGDDPAAQHAAGLMLL